MGAIDVQRSVSTNAAVPDSVRSSIPGLPIADLDGVPVLANAATIPGLLGIAFGAYIAARIQRPRWPLPMQWLLAIAWFVLFEIADTLHTLGHIRSARQADAPMDAVVLTTGLQMTIYEKPDVPP